MLTSNFDDHLRNHGFLHAGDGRWNLSPAYDMNPIPAHEHAGEMSTGISAETGKTASVDALLAGAGGFGLRQDEARSIIRDIAAVVSGWRVVARRVGITETELAPYETAFEHTEMKSALRLSAKRPLRSVGPCMS